MSLLKMREATVWKRFAIYAALGIVALLAIDTVRLMVARLTTPALATALGPAVAYTVELKESHSTTNPKLLSIMKENPIVARYIYAARSDGASMTAQNAQTRKTLTSQREILFASGEIVQVDDVRKVKTTGRLPDYRVVGIRDPGSRCTKTPTGFAVVPDEKLIGEEFIAGYKAVILQASDNKMWFAPDAGCAVLRTRREFTDGTVSEKNLVKLTLGEPSEDLFATSADYQEVPPSQYLRITDPKRAALLDQSYINQRQQKK